MKHITWSLILVVALLIGCERSSSKSGKGGKPRPMGPEAKKVLLAFRSAVSKSDWPQALSLCSETIQSKAAKYASLAEFCQTILPVNEIQGSYKFNAYASKIREGSEGEILEYECSVSLKNYEDVYWFCSVRKQDAEWVLDFSTEPLSNYAEEILKDRKLQAAEHQRRREALLPKLEKVRLKLTPLKPSFTVGESMIFRLEMTNGGTETLYYDDQQVKVNDSMTVKDSKGRNITYTAGPFQTVGGYRCVKPRQTVVLFDKYDLASQYKITSPGTYEVQFSGKGLSVGDREDSDSTEDGENNPSFALADICSSNSVKIEVVRPTR